MGVHEKRPLLPRPVEGWPYGSAVREDSHNLQSFAEGICGEEVAPDKNIHRPKVMASSSAPYLRA